MNTIKNTTKIKYLPIILLVFVIFTFLTIFAKYISNPAIENIFKPLLMPTLMVLYLINTPKIKSHDAKYLIAALVFSMLGDIFLMPLLDNFILGLLSFLIGHIFYILLLLKLNNGNLIAGLKKNKLVTFIIFMSYLSLVILLTNSMINNSSDFSLIIAVLIYASIISLMVFNSSSLYYNLNTINELIIFIGALFFMFSDSIIAINKFVSPIEFSGFYVMTTYCLAQFLIVYGVLRRELTGS